MQVSDPIGLSVVSYARKRKIPVVTTEHNQPEVITNSLKIGLLKKPVNAVLSSYFRNRQSKSDFVTMPTELAIRELIGEGSKFPVPVAAEVTDMPSLVPPSAPMQVKGKGTACWYDLMGRQYSAQPYDNSEILTPASQGCYLLILNEENARASHRIIVK